MNATAVLRRLDQDGDGQVTQEELRRPGGGTQSGRRGPPPAGEDRKPWIAAHLAELDDLAAAYLGDRSRLDEISRSDLHDRISRGDVVVVDVRPFAEFEAGHIAGARSIPIEELPDRLAELPSGVDVVAYCRGPYCVFADDAVRLARRRRRRAFRLEDGYPEWRASGRPVAVGPSPVGE